LLKYYENHIFLHILWKFVSLIFVQKLWKNILFVHTFSLKNLYIKKIHWKKSLKNHWKKHLKNNKNEYESLYLSWTVISIVQGLSHLVDHDLLQSKVLATFLYLLDRDPLQCKVSVILWTIIPCRARSWPVSYLSWTIIPCSARSRPSCRSWSPVVQGLAILWTMIPCRARSWPLFYISWTVILCKARYRPLSMQTRRKSWFSNYPVQVK